MALTLLDVLDYMEKIPMVTAYKLTDGTTTTRFPMGEALDTAQPVVEYLPGWHCDITAARKWEDLPQQARDYVEYLEKAVGCKITYISVGAEREATSTAAELPQKAAPEFQKRKRHRCLISLPTAPAT